MNTAMTAEELLKIVQVVLKDELAAVIRKRGDELTITFPGGERFAPPRQPTSGFRQGVNFP